MARRVRTVLYRYTMPWSSHRGNDDRKPLLNENQEPSLPPYVRTPFYPSSFPDPDLRPFHNLEVCLFDCQHTEPRGLRIYS